MASWQRKAEGFKMMALFAITNVKRCQGRGPSRVDGLEILYIASDLVETPLVEW